jgi:hypothetical protein
MIQVPMPTIVTVLPDTVHTAVVDDEKLTGSRELAVAVRTNGAAPRLTFGREENWICWASCMTVKFWVAETGA